MLPWPLQQHSTSICMTLAVSPPKLSALKPFCVMSNCTCPRHLLTFIKAHRIPGRIQMAIATGSIMFWPIKLHSNSPHVRVSWWIMMAPLRMMITSRSSLRHKAGFISAPHQGASNGMKTSCSTQADAHNSRLHWPPCPCLPGRRTPMTTARFMRRNC